MSVELEPSVQLSFTRPFNQMVREVLTIINNNEFPVAFKVKTTTPRQYCVRPNAGRINPNESVQVQVVLQTMREDPPPDFRCRDKFLVQSVAITPEREQQALPEMWQQVERESKEDIKERKLRCTYLMPREPTDLLVAAQEADNHAQGIDDAASDRSADDVMVGSLQRELREAKSTIRQLQDRNERQQRELNEAQSVARQRRTMDAGRTGTRPRQDGVVALPMQTIVAIIIASFFVGYWFF